MENQENTKRVGNSSHHTDTYQHVQTTENFRHNEQAFEETEVQIREVAHHFRLFLQFRKHPLFFYSYLGICRPWL